MANASPQDRAELIRRALSRKTRRSVFSPERPTKWHPTTLAHPADGEMFTADSCWSFVADAIAAGAEVEQIVLKKPPGKRGFVLKLAGVNGIIIYVKLQLLGDIVLGRSFHESAPGSDEDI
jgi:hypothetical protein